MSDEAKKIANHSQNINSLMCQIISLCKAVGRSKEETAQELEGLLIYYIGRWEGL